MGHGKNRGKKMRQIILVLAVVLGLLLLVVGCIESDTPGMKPHTANPELQTVAYYVIPVSEGGFQSFGSITKFRDGDVICYLYSADNGVGISCVPCVDTYNCKDMP